MIRLKTTVSVLNEIYLDEFKSKCKDSSSRIEQVLDLHKYFKYQVRPYTFTMSNIPNTYNDLRTGRLNADSSNRDMTDVSFPLLFLTELSQRLLIELGETEEEYNVSVDDILKELSLELAAILTIHGNSQTYIDDKVYQKTIDREEWVNVLITNPWLLVGILIRYTSDDLTEAMYFVYSEAAELAKGIKRE